ncbi:MAG: hypothetical protein QM831_21515 [Kofleriaceae bacterium]
MFTVACATETSAPETSSADQDLTAREVDTTYFSDAAFQNAVGESDLYCSGGKLQTGNRSSKYKVTFTWPCVGAGGDRVTCYELTYPGEYEEVACPAGLF